MPDPMHELVETLPLPQRLALAYAPRSVRAEMLALFAFDTHLAALVRQAREPIIGQMRLAWWRERLEEPVEQRPAGSPQLDALAPWNGREAALVALVDGWEHLLGDALGEPAIASFARGRAGAFAALAEPECEAAALLAGKRWALADLAAHLDSPGERRAVLAAADELGGAPVTLPRALRPLAVLDGLARRSLARGGAPLAAGPLSGLAALRLGIIGR